MSPVETLSEDDKNILLKLARQSIEMAVNRHPLPELDLESYSTLLRQPGASFVTLTENNDLRGCIGALEPYQPLVQDVCEHAAAAAIEDYRFRPVRPDEVSLLEIEISRLTPPERLVYTDPLELPTRLRSTFLPQVWEKIPDPATFLAHLCQKMGAPATFWRHKLLEVYTYQVEEFKEKK